MDEKHLSALKAILYRPGDGGIERCVYCSMWRHEGHQPNCYAAQAIEEVENGCAKLAGGTPEPLRGTVDWTGKTMREILDDPRWPEGMSDEARSEAALAAYDAHLQAEHRRQRDAEVDRAFDLVDVEAEAWRLAQLAATLAAPSWEHVAGPIEWKATLEDAAGLMAAARAKARRESAQ